MALAVAAELQAELHKIPSQKCNAQSIEDTVRHCWYAPLTPDGFHVVLADEADQMTNAAQLALLSKLDSTDPAPNTIWIFMANDTERLERRFLSRCKVLDFSSYGLAGEIASYLDTVWHAEGGNGNAPDLERMAKDMGVDAAKIGRLRQQGRSIREIADELGYSRSLVHKTLANRESGRVAIAAS